LWSHNFYNAPAVAKILKYMKTDCVGTLWMNRKDVPKNSERQNTKEMGNYSLAFWPIVWAEIE
jgi:hypothetical protein